MTTLHHVYAALEYAEELCRQVPEPDAEQAERLRGLIVAALDALDPSTRYILDRIAVWFLNAHPNIRSVSFRPR